MPRVYQHFCPVARSLEVIGERWSLLIVRDLLRGPQRFTDLQRYLHRITPRRLTLRLRDLETAGIVERDRQSGRREVWYRLTKKGRDLAPVIEGLAAWGQRHAMRPPLPGEAVHPEQVMAGMTFALNRRGRTLPGPAAWLLAFSPGDPFTLTFDGERWRFRRGAAANPDVTVSTAAEHWAAFLTVDRSERPRYAAAMRLEGEPERVEEFLRTFGVRPARPAAPRHGRV